MWNFFFRSKSDNQNDENKDKMQKESEDKKQNDQIFDIRSYNNRKYPRPTNYVDSLMQEQNAQLQHEKAQKLNLIISEPMPHIPKPVVIPIPSYLHNSQGNNIYLVNQQHQKMMELQEMIIARSRFNNWHQQLPNNFLSKRSIIAPSIAQRLSELSWYQGPNDPNQSSQFMTDTLQTEGKPQSTQQTTEFQIHPTKTINPLIIKQPQVIDYRCYCKATQCKDKKCGCFVKRKYCSEKCECIHVECKNMRDYGNKKIHKNQEPLRRDDDQSQSLRSVNFDPKFTPPDFGNFH